ncbi:MAG: flagellar hook-basal body complex protein [Butyrivibrio sp.]|nr:flagellar hook-basal body complex protein [Butyrivibrio sp.]
MMRSLFSGVAGLKTHQVKMDVIGNNIANVNTTAFKSMSITFSDLMYQNSQNATMATETKGGVNAKQIGLGAKSGAIQTAVTTQGATETTSNPFDLCITGESFFIVNDGVNTMYTRDGSFYVDGAGNLAMRSTGYYVYGWTATEDETTGEITVNTNGGINKLQIMTADNTTYPPEGTTQAVVSGNIDANDTNVQSDSGKTVTLEFYDNLGYLYTAKFAVRDDDTLDHTYSFTLEDILDSDGNSIGSEMLKYVSFTDDENGNGQTSLASTYTVSDYTDTTITLTDGTTTYSDIPRSGYVSTLTDATTTANFFTNVYGLDASTLEDIATYTIDEDGTLYYQVNSATLTYDSATGAITSPTGKLTIDFDQEALDANGQLFMAGFTDVQVDFSTTTNFNTNGTSTITAVKGDLTNLNTGRAVGEMTGITVGTDGKINASYSNGCTKLLGQIASAEFANASGLAKEGDNLYTATLNSGAITVQDITIDGGYMTSGTLEMSNVDLSSEFTSMITTQRGFQANSRIITVSDTLLEELTNLKR